MLSGVTLNNKSVRESSLTHYLTYSYGGQEYATESQLSSQNGTGGVDFIYFIPTGENRTESSDGKIYRSVIQAGGTVKATFSSDISNTNTTANAGKISNTIVAPSLNTPSAQSIGGGANQQALTDAGTRAITGPDWQDTTASRAIGGGTGLAPDGMDGNYPLPSGNNGYFVPSTDPDSRI